MNLKEKTHLVKGQELAVSYLANHYKKLNIPPVKNNSYFQPVPLQFESKPEISLNISDRDSHIMMIIFHIRMDLIKSIKTKNYICWIWN